MDSVIVDNTYMSMNLNSVHHTGKSVVSRKSVKRATRKNSFGVRIRVKRKVSIKSRNMEDVFTNKNDRVREHRSKSFIIKRKSFRKPRNWSSYLKYNGENVGKADERNLPRVKGFWKNQKYIHSRFDSWGRIWTEQWRRRKDYSTPEIWRGGMRNTGIKTIPRPTLVVGR